MATLVLSAAGAALGAGFGGTVLGLSGAVIGRAVGAGLGRMVDQRLLGGGSDAVETGRLDRLRLNGAGEGAAIARVWGRMRLAGQVIWASQFREHASTRGGGGKGRGPAVTSYSYSVSLGIGLCEGPILRVGRIWADGAEIAPRDLTLRVYQGDAQQSPDPLICAIEGADNVPGFRGLAYVVIEDLDLTPYGNRVPQFTFEVMRAAQTADQAAEFPLSQAIPSVAMIPGTGEFSLATTPVHHNHSEGRNIAVNSTTPSGMTDFSTSLLHLNEEIPACKSVSLVVSWFGSDLRCGECQIMPGVEQKQTEGQGLIWNVGPVTRSAALQVPMIEGRPVYGGTPCDASVIEAIAAIRASGKEVMFYPFILMAQMEGNNLPDPWTGGAGQAALPWRGRVTSSLSAGRPGTSERTAQADAEVAAFFGTASADDFTQSAGHISYSGPAEWRFRRFILHYAYLCRAAGGVDAFCIGSEMVGLTRIRNHQDHFPAVTALKALAAEVRSILGPDCRISYAADWTEYGSYVADGNLYFPLDPLWADPNIDFIGIDNSMPLADWREGETHADAHWGSTYDLEYLKSNIAGGEGFDWYYDSPEAEAAQNRIPITDGAFDEPWVYRVKDLTSWWSQPHHPRIGANRDPFPSDWVPRSKPIVFTEYGCAAVDKGANHPNRFLDQHSSESLLPRASDGRRDDLMQMQYLRAMASYWSDPEHNPAALAYPGRMLDWSRAHAWAWDARPYPAYPARADLWADAPSYRRGHWLNGRATNQPLSAVLSEICGATGLSGLQTRRAQGVVRGYMISDCETARASLQPLMLAYGVDAAETGGQLHFRSRQPGIDFEINPQTLAVTNGLEGNIEYTRQAEAAISDSLRINYIEADGDYTLRMAEARSPDASVATSVTASGRAKSTRVSQSELALVLTSGEGRALAQKWLAEAAIARDSLRLSLPPSGLNVAAGARLGLPNGAQYRVDQVELAGEITLEASRIEGALYRATEAPDDPAVTRPFIAPVPVFAQFLDLPLLSEQSQPHQPYLAVSAQPWPGPVGVWMEDGTGSFTLAGQVLQPATLGVTESELVAAAPGVWDNGPPLRIRLSGGSLESQPSAAVLNGANLIAIGPGDGLADGLGEWEVFQFCEAVLVGPQTWEVSIRLRGQLGSDGVMAPIWPAGSRIVLLNRALIQVDQPPGMLGLLRQYRIGALARGPAHAAVVTQSRSFAGVGLRPWPVAHLRAEVGFSGDVDFTWIRRTRQEGDSWNQTEVPLGEESESYLLRVLTASGGEEELRAEYHCSVPRFSYSDAMKAADGIAGSYHLDVAQVSARYGAGPARRIYVAS